MRKTDDTPRDGDAEQCVLGSILCDNHAMDEVSPIISAGSFFEERNQVVFRAMLKMYERGHGSGIDAVTLRHELETSGADAGVDWQSRIIELLQAVPHAAHATYYANIVRQKFLKRTLLRIATEILVDVDKSHDEDAEELFAKAESRIFQAVEGQATAAKVEIADILEETFARIFERIDAPAGMSSGFLSLDEIITGLRPSELIILAARPAMGKTALVCNMALQVAKAKHGVLLFSLEQSKLELAERMLCIQAKVSGHKLRKGDLGEMDQMMLMEAANSMRSFPLLIDDLAGQNMTRIMAVARRMKRAKDIGVVIIDYLQLIESEDSRTPREQQIASITRRLKFMAKELNIPVIALSQLNRAVEARENKKPKLSDLRESGAIEQDADIVMFLHREEAYDAGVRPGEADLIVAKNRHGPLGTADLVWMDREMRFADRAPNY